MDGAVFMCGVRRRMKWRRFDVGKVTKATVANTSISKAKTATYSALPKTADSNWTAASTVLLLLRIAILIASEMLV